MFKAAQAGTVINRTFGQVTDTVANIFVTNRVWVLEHTQHLLVVPHKGGAWGGGDRAG